MVTRVIARTEIQRVRWSRPSWIRRLAAKLYPPKPVKYPYGIRQANAGAQQRLTGEIK